MIDIYTLAELALTNMKRGSVLHFSNTKKHGLIDQKTD